MLRITRPQPAAHPAFVILVLAVLAISTLPPAPTAAAQEGRDGPADLLLILDASGSMWGQIEGENKIVIARRVLGKVVEELPEGSDVGLIAYGHRREGDCADIETVVPLGPLDRVALTGIVDGLNPKGKTPITASIASALEEMEGRDGATTMILVSDGLETCGGDPCATVAAAREAGVDFRLHVVGFGIEEGDVSQLECAAQAGGGLYLAAADAGQLQDALGRAVEASAAPGEAPATLAVAAVVNGEPADATVEVTPAGGGDAVAGGRTYTGPETNPRLLPVPPGRYDVVVRAIGLRGEPVIRFPGVEITAGEVVEKRADFSEGELAVWATRNGQPTDASVRVTPAEGGRPVAGGRTYSATEPEPKVMALTPGRYRVELEAVEMAGKVVHEWPQVEVVAGERTDLSHAWASGELAVGVVDGDELVDATVNVLRSGENVAGGRTYTADTSNPRRFVLPPGTYTVRVRAVRHPDDAPREMEVTVEGGGTTEETVRLGGG